MSTAEANTLLHDPNTRPHPRTVPRTGAFVPILLIPLFCLLSLIVFAIKSPYTLQLAIRKKAHPREIQGHTTSCDTTKFKKETLRLVSETTLAAFFGDTIRKYEASDITGDPSQIASAGPLILVLDNTRTLVRITPGLTAHALSGCAGGAPTPACNASLIKWPGDDGSPSNFEYVAFNSSSGRFLVGQEIAIVDGNMVSRMYDVEIIHDKVNILEECITEHHFTHKNKGIEGAIVVEVGGRSMLLGLCEGNHCDGGKHGRKPGHGRILAMERVYKDGKCFLRTVSVIKLSKDIDFQDHSALAVWDKHTIGIVSQEDSALFVGKLQIDSDGSLSVGAGKIYDFPRNDNCEIKYCNAEGLFFLDKKLIVTVTDTMKSHGKQAFRCREKDESFQIFQIP